ncbi:hypothetical protein FHU30_005082 [Actinomadura rupiterrae]|nr:hypothetical protein [Actinomadura rupiterrae]
MPGGHGLIMVSFLGGPQWSQRPQEGRGVAERDQVVGHDAVALRVALGPGPPSAFRLACSRYLPGAGCPPGEGRSPVGGSPSGHTHQARATWPLASPARRGPLPGGGCPPGKVALRVMPTKCAPPAPRVTPGGAARQVWGALRALPARCVPLSRLASSASSGLPARRRQLFASEPPGSRPGTGRTSGRAWPSPAPGAGSSARGVPIAWSLRRWCIGCGAGASTFACGLPPLVARPVAVCPGSRARTRGE